MVGKKIIVVYHGQTKRLEFYWDGNEGGEGDGGDGKNSNGSGDCDGDDVSAVNVMKVYSMQLPSPTDRNDITHWYPAVSIANSGNTAEIFDLRVDYKYQNGADCTAVAMK